MRWDHEAGRILAGATAVVKETIILTGANSETGLSRNRQKQTSAQLIALQGIMLGQRDHACTLYL